MRKYIALLIVLLLLILPNVTACTQTVGASFAEDYFTRLCKKDFAGTYEFLWKYGSSIEEEEYVKDWQHMVDALGITSISVKQKNISTENNVHFLNYTLTYKTKKAGTIENVCKVRMVESNGFFLEYSPSMLLGGYEQGDKISIVPLPGKRGEIFTSDHQLIASNDYAETVYINVSKDIDIAKTISSLSEILPLSDKEAVACKKRYDAAVQNSYATAVVKAYGKDSISSSFAEKITAVSGVGIDTDSMTSQRYYPYGNIFCHITGYTASPTEAELTALKEKGFENATQIGKAGLEKAYDEILQGKDGYRVQISSADGQYKSTVCEKAPVNGQDLILSINSKTQQKAYYLLASNVKKQQTGVAIVMNAKTGFVEAMVSTPSYDPNLFTAGISDKDYQALISKDSKQPLVSRATTGLYPPGSLFKPFTIAPSLEKGIVTRNTVFPYTVKNNQWVPPGETWTWPPITRNEEPDGPLNLDMAMKHSDNIYFSWAALKLGEENFLAYMQEIGIGETIPFDIETAKSNLLNKPENMNRKMLSDMSFGQGEILVTPIQMAAMYTAFQNNGDILAPKMVTSINQTEGDQYKVIKKTDTETYKSGVMSTKTINTLIPALKDVVESGTARSIQISGLTLAAKTGTALKGKDNSERTSWVAAWWQGMKDSRLTLVLIDGPRYDSAGNLTEERKFSIAHELLKP